MQHASGTSVGFDIETTGIGPDDIVTVACVWSPQEQAHCFFDDDFSNVSKMLDDAEHIYTFNGVEFDLPRFAKHCGRDCRRWAAKAVDPLYMMKHSMGLPACIKLGDLLKENGFDSKTASGLEAVQFWHNGERDLLLDYCMQDSRLTYELCTSEAIRWAGRWVVDGRKGTVKILV